MTETAKWIKILLLNLTGLIIILAFSNLAAAQNVSCWRGHDWEMQVQPTGKETAIIRLHYIGHSPCMTKADLYQNKGRLSEGKGFCMRYNKREVTVQNPDPQNESVVTIEESSSGKALKINFSFQGEKELLDPYDPEYSPTPCFHGSNPF